MNSPITVVSSERMTNLLTNIDITNGFIADFKDKIKVCKYFLFYNVSPYTPFRNKSNY